MIKIEQNPNLDTIDWERLSEMFELVEWGKRDPQEIEQAFRMSTITCFAIYNGEVVGFGRTVDDGKYYALLVDVVIHPDYQALGIGRSIVDRLRNNLIGYEFVTLTAAPNKEGFYEKLGWMKQKSSYIMPKDDKQKREHCL
jgi:ribosomal protein S18 acetylase RimI-like enzyme